MMKKGLVISIVIVFLVGSFASGITINFTDSIEQTELKFSQYRGSRGSGLVAYWNFDDGTAEDKSGNGHDGTIYGATTVEGISVNGFRFDGYDDYIDFGDDPDFDITGDITIALWFN
jgi:hypothetical protein